MLLNFVNNNDIVNTNTDKINGSLTENRCSIVDIARKHDGDDVDLLNGAVDETINKSQESSDNLLIDINDTTKIDSPVLIDIKISTPEETSTIDAEQHNLKIDPELSECMSNKQLIEGDSNVSKSFSLNDPVIPVFKDPLPPASDDFDTWTTVAEATTEDVVETKPEEVDTSPVIVEDLEIKKSEDLEIKESEDLENQKSEDQELVVVESVTTTKKTEFETKSSIIEAVSCTREIVIIEQTSTTNGPISEETITDEADASSVSVQHVVCETVVGSNKSKDVTESSESVITEKKTVKKKKSSEGGETTATKTKKTKKTKKSEEKENHISVRRSFGDLHKACENAELTTPEPPAINNSQKSSFSKFDQLQKKTLLHVRSSDSSRAQKTFGGAGEPAASPTVNPPCKSCGKTVFAMEQVKAERSVWHKNCFRCQECNKQLTLDIYSSHEGVLYCKPHFRELFKPKAVVENEDEPVVRRRPEMIIRENQPLELPPDVVRASDKPDLGLEELNSLNVKSRFQAFEKPTTENGHDSQPSSVNVKRSPSILSKLAKFQKKGMDIGVTDESLNGIDYEESSSSGEEEDGKTAVRKDGVVRSTKAIERPTAFGKMEDVKRSWESGQAQTKEEWLEERKREKHSIRSRLFMGKQGKMKEMYEQAVAESEGGKGSSGLSKKEVESLRSDKARTVREKFERGEVVHSDSDEESDKHKHNGTEDMSVFEEGISKKSRSLFLEMDANVAKTKQSTPVPTPQPVQHQNSLEATRRARDVYISRGQVSTEDVVKSSDRVEDVTVQTADVSNKFKFFETYKPPEKEKKSFRFTPPREGQVKTESPDREIYRDPNVVRSDDPVAEDEAVVKRSQTTSKMLSIFRQMEEAREPVPEGLKPLKRFTPPPDYKEDEDDEEEEEEEEEESEEEEEEESEEEENNGIVRASDKIEDEFLKQAQNAARAKSLKEKFEHWEPEKQSKNNAINMLDSDQASLDSTKSLRAHFESLKSEQPKEKSRPKVNRFVDPAQSMSVCAACDTKVYILERVETNGKVFHKKCFRCTQCSCVLRMETYTLNNGQLYCLPHFKQLFIVKGNYDEGFGSDQHKRKWEATIVNGSH
ncbi:LIM domain and actin-binding protein 1 isoform X23 [Nilaparvata lugens]|uniref:LIM domain and actin-binding protein 1 isoform X23 n=1 Tax=Nilaparvata lugens TaxID=108931 RepID=UPI00193CEC23|nr:LIM domain and actin-binding protein 1 isoform X23 [Nilaparvata lugens]